MSCPSVMSTYADGSSMGFGSANNTMFDCYYSSGPEYMHEEGLEFDAGQELICLEDVTQYDGHFMSYSGEEESLDSYHSDEFDFPDSSLMDDQSSMSGMEMSPVPTPLQPHPDQVALQIQRNEELARLLSPIRKCQENMQQTKKNAENARRKFSLTNGIRAKRQTSLNMAPKPQKITNSIRRWQSEILSKLPKQQQCRQKNTPNVNAPLSRWPEQQEEELESYSPVQAQRRFSLQPVPEYKELFYCSSR